MWIFTQSLVWIKLQIKHKFSFLNILVLKRDVKIAHENKVVRYELYSRCQARLDSLVYSVIRGVLLACHPNYATTKQHWWSLSTIILCILFAKMRVLCMATELIRWLIVGDKIFEFLALQRNWNAWNNYSSKVVMNLLWPGFTTSSFSEWMSWKIIGFAGEYSL